MRRPPLTLLAVAALALILPAACGSAGDEISAGPATDEGSAPEPVATTSESGNDQELPETPTSERGNFIKSVGQPSGVSCHTEGFEGCELAFTINRISVSEACESKYDEAPIPAERSRLVIIDATATTSADFTPSELPSVLNRYDFLALGEDGFTESDIVPTSIHGCEAYKPLPNPLQPSSNYRFSLVFDVPSPTGTLIYNPNFTDGGWEWAYPSG